MNRAEWYAYVGIAHVQKSQLAWCHMFVPTTVAIARDFINHAGDLALAACVTDADYLAVSTCFEIAHQLVKEDESLRQRKECAE